MIEISNQIINADELLERVRKNILNKQIGGLKEEIIVANISINENSKAKYILEEYRRSVCQVSALKHIEDPEITSYKRRFAKLKIFIKKVIKKLTFWIIKPYWDQQNMYNEAVLEALKRLDELNEVLLETNE